MDARRWAQGDPQEVNLKIHLKRTCHFKGGKIMKQKLCCAFLAVLIALSVLQLPALAAGADENAPQQIVILCTNDVHCEIDPWKDGDGTVENLGYAGVASYKQEMQAQYGADNVTLVDAGDAIQGSAVGTLSNGAYLVEIMNQVGYDYAVPGNHEFDYGMDNFLSLAAGEHKMADYTYLCANFRDKNGDLLFQPYEIVDYGPVQVAYVGISTPETLSKSTPIYFQDENGQYIYSFGADGTKLYEDVQSAVDQARQEGADFVVAIAHLGQTGITQAWRSDEVLTHTTGIDVMLDGHSHERLQEKVQNKEGQDVLLLQTGHNLTALSKVTIDVDSGEIAGELITNYDGSEEKTAALLESIHTQLDEKLQAQIGTLAVDLVAEDEQENQLVRNQETNLGDFCADAYRIQLQADIAFVNGGGIRANVTQGVVTYGDIIAVHPYNNQLSVAEVTGQQLLDALEMGARLYPEPCGGFLQVSGMTYEIDASIPSHVVVDDKAAFVRVDGEYRVKNVTVGGAPLDLTKTYRLASHDYMLKQGGDGMTMFQNCNIPESEVMLDNQALIRYMDSISGAAYQNRDGEGRIQVLNAQGKPYSDVPSDYWAYDAISFVTSQGLFQEAGDTFSPDAPMTRGTLMAALWRLQGSKVANYAMDYTDVDQSAWYAEAIRWATSEGIACGYGDRRFGPDNPVTREEMACVLYHYEQKYGGGGFTGQWMFLLDFDDRAEISEWAYEPLCWMTMNHIMEGKDDKILDPKGGVTRAEAATMLTQYMKK